MEINMHIQIWMSEKEAKALVLAIQDVADSASADSPLLNFRKHLTEAMK